MKAENAHGQVKMIGRSVRFGHAKRQSSRRAYIVLWYLAPLENYKPSRSFYEQASPAIIGASPAWVLGARRPDGAATGGSITPGPEEGELGADFTKSWHQITAVWGRFSKNLVRKFALVDLRS